MLVGSFLWETADGSVVIERTDVAVGERWKWLMLEEKVMAVGYRVETQV